VEKLLHGLRWIGSKLRDTVTKIFELPTVQKLLGGRPMITVTPSRKDVVSGKIVYDFVDVYGRMWMANTRWGWGRVRKGQDWADQQAQEKKELEAAEKFEDTRFYKFND
jgi:hypothetical protein